MTLDIVMFIFPVAPEVSTTEMPNQNVTVGGTIELTCNFNAVPTPIATFFLNGVALDESDPRVTVVTTQVDSTLTLTNIAEDEGGYYSCLFSNTVGSMEINVTTLIVFGRLREKGEREREREREGERERETYYAFVCSIS